MPQVYLKKGTERVNLEHLDPKIQWKGVANNFESPNVLATDVPVYWVGRVKASVTITFYVLGNPKMIDRLASWAEPVNGEVPDVQLYIDDFLLIGKIASYTDEFNLAEWGVAHPRSRKISLTLTESRVGKNKISAIVFQKKK